MPGAAALGQIDVGRQTEKANINLLQITAKIRSEESGNSGKGLEIHKFAIGTHSLGHFVVARAAHVCLHCFFG
jgi:hypothetical protein